MNDREILENGLNELKITYNEQIIDNFFIYKSLLLEWNEKINLTAITESEEIIKKHFLDSIATLTVLKSNISVIDIGTGAGFPGIPMKLCDDSIKLTLVDSLKKRVNFLDHVINKLNINDAITVHMRSEDGGKSPIYREKYDVAVSRAVATLSVLCEYCLPYVKIGGKFIALKGKNVFEEIKESEDVIKILGGKVSEVVTINIPFTDINHYLLIIEKIKVTPKKYPRILSKIK